MAQWSSSVSNVYFSKPKRYSLKSGEIDTTDHFSDYFHFVCDKFKIPNGILHCVHLELILL